MSAHILTCLHGGRNYYLTILNYAIHVCVRLYKLGSKWLRMMGLHCWKHVTAWMAVVMLVILMIIYVTFNTSLSMMVSQTGVEMQGPGLGGIRRLGTPFRRNDTPHLAVAICAGRLEEPLTMLKSVVLFTNTTVVVHVVTDSMLLQEQVTLEIESWPSEFRTKLTYRLYNASFPADVQCEDCSELAWKSLFAPCSAQRLFLGDLLADVDSVLYVDADTLFLAPIEEAWSFFQEFNSTQFIAGALVTEIPKTGAYHRKGNIPFYGLNGINAGVLLMNLTRMRASTWTQSATESLSKYNKAATHFDQDLINIFMHDHPENSALLPCDWNVRIDQCIHCLQVNETGVALLHGFLHSLVENTVLTFKGVYAAFREFQLGKHSIKHDLLRALKWNLKVLASQKSARRNFCHKNTRVFSKRIEFFIHETQRRRIAHQADHRRNVSVTV